MRVAAILGTDSFLLPVLGTSTTSLRRDPFVPLGRQVEEATRKTDQALVFAFISLGLGRISS